MSSILDGIRVKPCVNCGFCCSQGPCGLAVNHYGNSWKSPCPALVEKDGRRLCKIVLEAEDQQKRDYMKFLAIGAGCSSTLFNEMRDTQIARMKNGRKSDGATRRADGS